MSIEGLTLARGVAPAQAVICSNCSIGEPKHRRRSLALRASRMTPHCGNIYLSERPRTHERADD
jgi:hypothetical protein